MKWIVWLVLAGALIFAGLRQLERISLYIPSSDYVSHPGTYGIPYEKLRLKTEDGLTLRGWFIDSQAPESSRALDEPPLPELPRLAGSPVVLFFQGNGGNMSYRVQKIRYFKRMGASVLIFDYRGYGKSQGRPGEAGTYLDARAAAAEALLRAGDPSRLFYYGESLGCAVALETALRLPPRGIVMDSPFTATAEMGEVVFPWLPSRWIVKNRYDNISKIAELKTPLLILHSAHDDIIPFEMGRRLFAAAPQPKRFVETGGDHNGGFLDTPHWGPSIAAFLLENFK